MAARLPGADAGHRPAPLLVRESRPRRPHRRLRHPRQPRREPVMKTTFLILLAAALALAAATSARLVIILLAIALVVAVAARCTLFSTHRVRRMRWRIMVRLRPGPGFATLAELTVRWSRLAALRHGRRARPSMRLHHRTLSRTTEYAIRLGRAQYFRRVFARAEDQTLILVAAPVREVRDAGGPGDRPSRRRAGHRIPPRHLHRHRRVPRPARPHRGVQPRERLRHPLHVHGGA